MAQVECSACFLLVRPRSDGSCPSCGADTRGKKSVLVRMQIGEASALPDVCASCAAPATKHVAVTRARGTRAFPSWLSRLFALLGYFAGMFIFGRVFRRLAGTAAPAEKEGELADLRLRVPMCHACANAGAPQVLHADYRGAKLSVLVHRKFRSAAQRLRKSAKATA